MKPFVFCCILAMLTDYATAQTCVRRIVVPDYPRLARIAGIQGSVALTVEIRSDGSVASATALDGHRLLQEASEKNIRHWSFCATPATANTITIQYLYKLEGDRDYHDPPPKVILDLPDRVKITSQPYETQE